MVRQFLRHSAIYAIPSVVSSMVSFALFPLYAHHFTPSEYGVFDLLNLILQIVLWTVALEIYQGVARFTSGVKDLDIVRDYASTALWFAFVCYSMFLVLTEVAATPLSHLILGDNQSVTLWRVGVAWMWISGILQIVQAQLRWQLRPGAWTFVAMLSACVPLPVSFILVFPGHLGVEGAVLGQLCGAASGLVAAVVLTREIFDFRFKWHKCREMVGFSLPLVPASVGLFLNLYADRLVVQHEKSLYYVGLYGVGYRLASIIQLLLIGFQSAVTPLIYSRREDPDTPRQVARMFSILSTLALAGMLAISLFATPLVRVLAASEYQAAEPLVPLLLAAVLFSNMYNFTPGLQIARKSGLTALITGSGGLLNLALALVLVHLMGLIGAGIATAVSSLVWFAVLTKASQRYFPVPFQWRRISSAVGIVVLIALPALLLLPNSRATALSPTLLAIRAVLVLVGTLLLLKAGLSTEELQRLRRFPGELRSRGLGRTSSASKDVAEPYDPSSVRADGSPLATNADGAGSITS